jgi:two-component system OmpR family response regulator
MTEEITCQNSTKIKLDFSSRKIFVDDSLVIMRNKLFELLVCFVKHSGEVVTRTQLLEEVWDRNICWPTNTLDVHVALLRKTLGKRLGYDLIRTVHCIGYIFEI